MSTQSKSKFTARVDGHRLLISKLDEEQQRTLCILDQRRWPEFFIRDQSGICRDFDGREIELSTNLTDSYELMGAVDLAIRQRALKSRDSRCWIAALSVALPLLVCGAYLFKSDSAAGPVVSVAADNRAIPAGVRSALPPAQGASVAAARTEADVWTLPEASKAEVMRNLANAAERKAFTVDYSTGHQRTLYVFADPSCPNCQRLEPVLEAVANGFNVVVFPVAVIGKERSISAVTSVLCLPSEARKSAWTSLFDPGHGGLTAGKAVEPADDLAEPGACDMASKALAVNEVAYKSYRIPGTPWVISDDGRHVSQETLRDPAKLGAFMAAEVMHGAE